MSEVLQMGEREFCHCVFYDNYKMIFLKKIDIGMKQQEGERNVARDSFPSFFSSSEKNIYDKVG